MNENLKIPLNPYKWTPFRASLALVIGLVAVIALGRMCLDTGFLPSKFAESLSGDNLGGINMLKDIVHPDFSPELLLKLSRKMLETIEIGFLGTLLAVILSLPLGFIGAFNLMGKKYPQRGIFYSTRVLFNAVRAFEAFILLLILASIFGYNALAGIIAIGIHSVGMLGKLYSEAIENVDKGPIEAIQAVGGNRLQVIFYGILPQTFPLFIGYSLYRFDINVRMAVILGYIGVGGIGELVLQYINYMHFQKLSTTFILTLIVITLIDYLSTLVRNKVLA